MPVMCGRMRKHNIHAEAGHTWTFRPDAQNKLAVDGAGPPPPVPKPKKSVEAEDEETYQEEALTRWLPRMGPVKNTAPVVPNGHKNEELHMNVNTNVLQVRHIHTYIHTYMMQANSACSQATLMHNTLLGVLVML